MALLAEYGLFFAKTITLVLAIGLLLGWLISLIAHGKQADDDQLEINHLNKKLEQQAETLYEALLSKRQLKAHHKHKKNVEKQRDKQEKLGKKVNENRLFVLDFDGDIKASAVDSLRDEITAILQIADAGDKALIRLESGGGMVHSYGLAASQLKRLRDHGIHLTVAVDKVAASGGYMMACVADHIAAAPFSIIGSIGVVAQVPNFNKVLKKQDIDYELHTAGDYKRTLTLFGENTDEARQKFQEELETTHTLFKDFVAQYRPNLDINAIATGEHWHGSQALKLGLVDELATSDDLLLKAVKDDLAVYSLHYQQPSSLFARLTGQAAQALSQGIEQAVAQLTRRF